MKASVGVWEKFLFLKIDFWVFMVRRAQNLTFEEKDFIIFTSINKIF